MALPETGQTTRNVMVVLIVIGALLATTGLGLAVFTKIITHQGITGVLLITGLIVGGLALSVPAKLYLTLQLMRHADEKAAMRRAGE